MFKKLFSFSLSLILLFAGLLSILTIIKKTDDAFLVTSESANNANAQNKELTLFPIYSNQIPETTADKIKVASAYAYRYWKLLKFTSDQAEEADPAENGGTCKVKYKALLGDKANTPINTPRKKAFLIRNDSGEFSENALETDNTSPYDADFYNDVGIQERFTNTKLWVDLRNCLRSAKSNKKLKDESKKPKPEDFKELTLGFETTALDSSILFRNDGPIYVQNIEEEFVGPSFLSENKANYLLSFRENIIQYKDYFRNFICRYFSFCFRKITDIRINPNCLKR